MTFFCVCAECGLRYGEPAKSRAEAIYLFEEKCLDSWKRSPNGLLDWMKKPPKSKDDTVKRLYIYKCVTKAIREAET